MGSARLPATHTPGTAVAPVASASILVPTTAAGQPGPGQAALAGFDFLDHTRDHRDAERLKLLARAAFVAAGGRGERKGRGGRVRTSAGRFQFGWLSRKARVTAMNSGELKML